MQNHAFRLPIPGDVKAAARDRVVKRAWGGVLFSPRHPVLLSRSFVIRLRAVPAPPIRRRDLASCIASGAAFPFTSP